MKRLALLVIFVPIYLLVMHFTGNNSNSGSTAASTPKASPTASPHSSASLSPTSNPASPDPGALPTSLGPRDTAVVKNQQALAERFALEYLNTTEPEASSALAQRLSGLITSSYSSRMGAMSVGDSTPAISKASVTGINDGPTSNTFDVIVNWTETDPKGAVLFDRYMVMRVAEVRQSDGTWRVDSLEILQ